MMLVDSGGSRAGRRGPEQAGASSSSSKSGQQQQQQQERRDEHALVWWEWEGALLQRTVLGWQCKRTCWLRAARQARPMQGPTANGQVQARVPWKELTSCPPSSPGAPLVPAIPLASCSPWLPASTPNSPSLSTPSPAQPKARPLPHRRRYPSCRRRHHSIASSRPRLLPARSLTHPHSPTHSPARILTQSMAPTTRPLDAPVKHQLQQRPVDSSPPIARGAALSSLSAPSLWHKVALFDPAARGA